MSYRPFHVETWTDDRVQRLSLAGLTVWNYLLTGPLTSSMPGLVFAGPGTVSDHLARWLDYAEVEEAFRELSGGTDPLVLYDPASRVLLKPKALIYERPHNPDTMSAWVPCLNAVPDCALKRRFVRDLRDHCEDRDREAKNGNWLSTFMTKFDRAWSEAQATEDLEMPLFSSKKLSTPAVSGSVTSTGPDTVSPTVSPTVSDTVSTTVSGLVSGLVIPSATATATASESAAAASGGGGGDLEEPLAAAANFSKNEKTKNPGPAGANQLRDVEFMARLAVEKLGMDRAGAKRVFNVHSPERILRAAERALEGAARNPVGYFLKLVKDPDIGPSQAERDRDREASQRLAETIRANNQAARQGKLEADDAASAAELARWEAEVWSRLDPAGRALIDAVVNQNPFLAKLVAVTPLPDAYRLARMQASGGKP